MSVINSIIRTQQKERRKIFIFAAGCRYRYLQCAEKKVCIFDVDLISHGKQSELVPMTNNKDKKKDDQVKPEKWN
jgi:hypothetical protein